MKERDHFCQGLQEERKRCKRLWQHVCLLAFSQMFVIRLGVGTFDLEREGDADVTLALNCDGMLIAWHILNAAKEIAEDRRWRQ